MNLFSSKVSALLLLTTIFSAAPCLAKPALVLEQHNYLGAKLKVYLTKTAIRLEHPTTGLVAITRYPFKEVEVINIARRSYVVKSTALAVEQMNRATAFSSATDVLLDEKWSKGESTTLYGLPALVYSRQTSKKSWSRAWVLKEPALPSLTIDLICGFAGSIPAVGGVPLKLQQYLSLEDQRADEYETLPRKAITIFNTTSQKTVSVPESLFQRPKDFLCANGTNNAVPTNADQKTKNAMFASPDFLFQSDKKRLTGH